MEDDKNNCAILIYKSKQNYEEYMLCQQMEKIIFPLSRKQTTNTFEAFRQEINSKIYTSTYLNIFI